MNIFTHYNELPDEAREHVVVIGNFDGVHLGHKALIDLARDKADALGVDVAVLTFEPHPRRLFKPDEAPSRVTPPTLKYEQLNNARVSYIYALPFDWDFASQSYQDFIQNILIDGLRAKHIFVGADFCFGQLRKGSPQDIESAGIPTTIVEKVQDSHDLVYSSSRVRQFLRHGKITEANAVLGWDWEIRGEVIKGDQRGRELGYPTANVMLGDTIHPLYGVYAARVRIASEDTWHHAAMNIGIRPMFEVSVGQVESYIFDFDRDIYGEILHVQPVKRLRGEAKFDTLDDLIVQMGEDCRKAQAILNA